MESCRTQEIREMDPAASSTSSTTGGTGAVQVIARSQAVAALCLGESGRNAVADAEIGRGDLQTV